MQHEAVLNWCHRLCDLRCRASPAVWGFPGSGRSRHLRLSQQHSAALRDEASGRILVEASPERVPDLDRQSASGRADCGEHLKVFLTGRAGREQDEHPGWRTALVGKGVNPALRNVEKIALHRVDPGFPVEEPDCALGDIEGLGEGLVKVWIGAA